MENIVSLTDFRKEKQDLKLGKLIGNLEEAFRQDSINNIDKILGDLQQYHDDLFAICNWRDDFRYSEELKPWEDQDAPSSTPDDTIVIHKRDYEEYRFIKGMLDDMLKKYK